MKALLGFRISLFSLVGRGGGGRFGFTASASRVEVFGIDSLGVLGCTYSLHCSSFSGSPYRILKILKIE